MVKLPSSTLLVALAASGMLLLGNGPPVRSNIVSAAAPQGSDCQSITSALFEQQDVPPSEAEEGTPEGGEPEGLTTPAGTGTGFSAAQAVLTRRSTETWEAVGTIEQAHENTLKAITTGQVPPVISAIGQSAGTCIKKASGASSYDPEAIKAAACACFSNWFGDVLQLNELVNSAEAVPGDYETEALKRVAAYYDLDAEPSVARTQGAMAEATLISSLSDDELASLESQAMSDAHKLREKVRADRVQLTATARTVREVRDDLARSVKNGNDNMGCPADLKLP